MSDPGTLLLLVLLGGWVALDGASVGQVMVSRPLVSGTLTGWILGDPGTGLLLGMILEGAHLGDLPAGGARLPEPGPAAIPAVAAAIHLGGWGGMAAGLALGAAWSLLGGLTVTGQRRLNGRIVRGVGEGRVQARGVVLRHWGCIALDALRGGGLTAAGLLVASFLPDSTDGAGWTAPLLLLPAALSGGALLRAWSPLRRRKLLFVAGLAGGLAFAALLELGGGG